MKLNRIVFRADGGSATGLGHIMRCLSLAELLSECFTCLFIVNAKDVSVKELISNICESVFIDLPIADEVFLLKEMLKPSDIFVADGYHFNEAYQLAIKKLVGKLVMIDDKAESFFYADVIFNHGDITNIPSYKTALGTQVYSGFSYLIARKEFIEAARQKRYFSKIDTAFICMGGSDPYGITQKAIEGCLTCADIQKIIIVTGSVFSHKEALKVFLSTTGNHIEHYENLNAAEMVYHIQRSQIAFSTSSSISLEICCVKAGLISGVIIDNQKAIHSQLVKNKCCLSVGNWIDNSVEQIGGYIRQISKKNVINEIINRQTESIDGRSGERIMKIFKGLVN